MADPKLTGSKTYTAPIEISDGKHIAPETLVAAAFTESKLDEKAWNALSEAAHDEKLGATLEGLQAAAEEGKLPEGIKFLEDTGGAKPASAAKAARGEEIPEWQKPDYKGPLHGSQAEWRNTHLTHHRIKGTGPYKIKGEK